MSLQASPTPRAPSSTRTVRPGKLWPRLQTQWPGLSLGFPGAGRGPPQTPPRSGSHRVHVTQVFQNPRATPLLQHLLTGEVVVPAECPLHIHLYPVRGGPRAHL